MPDTIISMDKRSSPSLIVEGAVLGRLTATLHFEMRIRPDGRNRCFQKFECKCGEAVLARPYTVMNGNTSSCGCLHSENVRRVMVARGGSHYHRIATLLEDGSLYTPISKTSSYRVALNKARRAQKRAATAGAVIERLTVTIFNEILEAYNNQCWICSVELDVVQWDHVHPLSKGGPHVRANLRPACRPCNGRKGVLHPFTDEMKTRIAEEVRALRTPQGHTNPDRDGLEVNRACHT